MIIDNSGKIGKKLLKVFTTEVKAAEKRPIWEGDLNDDCTATWNGLMLRAECMDNTWWWAVAVEKSSGIVDSCYNHTGERCAPKTGEEARKEAEEAAINYLKGSHLWTGDL